MRLHEFIDWMFLKDALYCDALIFLHHGVFLSVKILSRQKLRKDIDVDLDALLYTHI